MRRILLLALLLSALLQGVSEAAIAFVREGHNDKGASTTMTITVQVDAGTTVVVCVSLGSAATQTITSVLDNNAVAYDFAGTSHFSTTEKTWCYTKLNAPASTSIVWIWGVSSVSNGVALVYSGVDTIGTPPNAVGDTTGSSTNPSVSVTTQDANNYVVAVVTANGTSTVTQENGTLRLSNFNGAQASRFITALDNTAATATSVTNSVILGTSRTWWMAGVELRSAAAAASTLGSSLGFLEVDE